MMEWHMRRWNVLGSHGGAIGSVIAYSWADAMAKARSQFGSQACDVVQE